MITVEQNYLSNIKDGMGATFGNPKNIYLSTY